MAETIKARNLSLALRYIVDNFGKNTLLNPGKVEAILTDLIPQSEIEINWIIDSINSGIMKVFVEVKSSDDQSRQEILGKATEIFEKYYITGLRKDYILDNISYALGWSDIEIDNLSEYEVKRNEKISQDKSIQSKQSILTEDIASSEEIHNIQEDELAYDDEDEEYYDEDDYPQGKKKSKLRFLWILLIPILLVAGYFGYKLLSGPGDVSVSNIEFSEKYELQNDIYTFDEGKDVTLTVTLEGSKSGKIDEKKVSYALDDPSICTYRKIAYNKCELIGMSNGNTTINVYYGGEKIESIDIGFSDINGDSDENNAIAIDKIQVTNMEKENSGYILKLNNEAEISVTLKGKDINNDLLSYSIDDTSLANISGYQNKCKISAKEEGSTTLRILYNRDEIYNINITIQKDDNNENLNLNSQVDTVIKEYWANYANASNKGDISYLQNFITPEGELHNELVNTLAQSSNKTTEVIGYTKDNMKDEGGKYRVGIIVQSNIKEGEITKSRKEYMEFIVIQENGQWLIDKVENKQVREEKQI